MAENDNASLVHRLFDAFSRQDGMAMRDVFDEEAVWVVPGTGVMAGTHRGRAAIFAFLGRLPKETGGSYRSRLIDVLVSENRAAALYRASGERNGHRLDLDQVLLFDIEGGLVRQVLALPSDPEAFDAFWAA